MTIATIISISGQAWARDEAGNLRELRVGDTLQEGETLVTSDNGRVELDFADGLGPTVIDGGQEVVMTPDLDAEQPVVAEEASAQDEDLEALLTAIDEGEGDLLEDLDATAAGAGGAGGEGGGHDFVRLARITENVNPLSYEYGLASLGGIPEVEGQAVEEPGPEDEPDSFPTVDTIDLDGDGDTVWESALPEGSGGGTLTTSGTFQIDTGTDLVALIEVQDAEGNWIAVGAEGSTIAGEYGTLTVNPDGSWTYTLDQSIDQPSQGETGEADQLADTFAVRVTDDDGDVSAPATLTIDVNDDGPVATDDSDASIAEDTTTALTGDVLANDTLGADRPASVAFDDTQASYGTFTDNGDGTWSYSLDNNLAAVQALGEGDTLTETFSYTLTDADGDESTASLTITITGQDDGVTLTGLSAEGAEQTVAEANLPDGSSPEAAALTQSGTFSFTALDELGSLSVGGESLSLADLQALGTTPVTLTSGFGTLTLTGFSGDAAGGTLNYTYTLDAAVDNDSVADATDTGYLDSFAVSVVDADGSSASASLDVRIVDDTPSAEDDPNASIAEDTTTALTGDVLANDTLGADRPASVAFDDTQASYGTFTDNGDGTWSYSLDNNLAAVQALGEGDTLTETFSYTLTDADGDESTASLTITIDGQTDGPPTIVVEDVDGSLTGADNNVVEATGNTVSGTATVTAEAGIATLTAGGQDITNASATNPVTLAGSYGTLVITGFDAATGVISYDYTEDGNAEDHSGGDDSIVDSFGLVVTDLAGETASDSLDIQVRDTEPEAGDDSASIAEDTTTALTGDVLANDTLGADRPASVAFDDTQASYGTFTDNGDGTWSYTLDNSLAAVQALGEGDTLTETFGYTLTDADGDMSTASLTITITGQDDGVTLTGLSAEGAEQTVAEANLPAGSSPEASALTQSGTFSFTALDELGSLSVGGQSLSLADLQGLSASTPLTLTSDHGTLTLTGFSGGAAGGTLSYSYTLDSTVDNDSVADATDGGYLDSFAVSVVDADGSSASASLTVDIIDDVPSATNDTGSVQSGGTLTVTAAAGLLANDTLGADGATVTAVDDSTAQGELTWNPDGSYSYTAIPDASYSDVFTYTITDGDGDTTSATLTIDVTDGSPTAPTVDVTVNEGALDLTQDGDDLAAGSVTGSNPTSTAETISGTLGATDPNGDALTYTAGTFSGSYGTLTIDAAGNYTYTLTAPVDGPTADDGTNTIDNAESFGYTVTDANGNSSTGTLTVDIIDDVPIIMGAENSVTFNTANYTASGGLFFDAGADGIGDLVFRGFTDGQAGVLADGTPMTVGGQPVYWFGEGTDTITGRLEGESGDMVFSASLNDDGSYTFTTFQSIDAVSNFEIIDIGSLGIGGGNSGAFVVGSDTPDNDFDDILITAVQPGGTINTSNDDLGTGNQWVDTSEGVRFEFVTSIQADATFDDYRLITGANVSLADVKGGGAQTDVLLAIYDQGGTNALLTSEQEFLDTVSAISYMSGGTRVTLSGADEIQAAVTNGTIGFVENYSANGTLVSGLVIYGVDENSSVGITASTEFDTIDIVNFDAPSFSINGIDSAAITNEPVDIGLSYAVIDGDGDESGSEGFNVTLNPVIDGTAGNDTLLGTESGELIIGSEGDDILTGGLGADTFVWNFGDQGTSTDPAEDTVTDFTSAQGDVLDVSDLLSNMSDGADLSGYIQAEESASGTILYISSEGSLTADDVSAADQTILLSNVDMGEMDSTQFLQSLINEGQLDIE
ncbi:retention module-containing protein [Halomonas sp. CKK8]|uniref:retention module-containing protein n=1 Tax=Halomonas sp. CKK8 TaxID=3036127 RepID=UPI00241567E7|nr:retention module-containing protein [Halomonas sp. CKK8]WFM73010.1 retention module-containing protein [Halomonas sp. CKK8]